MLRALRLAALGRHASPNPMVGCVIIGRDGKKQGEGFHHSPGQPHAEVLALRQAGPGAVGSTVYVTLEPCSHIGRTPPCADALIAAGVAKVVVAMVDPDRRVAGQGVERLLQAGLIVEMGALENEARTLNSAYIHHRTTGLPWVTVKIATTLDGKTATVTGDSRWITSPITRQWVHRGLRDRCDAVIVGIGTVLKDDPALTTRLKAKVGRDPLRIIIDSSLKTPLNSQVVRLSERDGKTLICCLAHFPQNKEREYASHGVQLLPIDADETGRVDLTKLMHALGTRRDVVGVLVEGGSTLIASAVHRDLVNRYITTVAPKLIGGDCAPGSIGGSGIASTMRDAIPLKSWRVRRSAVDLVIDAQLNMQTG
jgi:diaminohydroxyphosphoribosylaminopyrimidine deaminase / 5-amino-6-(5-phosphoribosylamino)uracil reductase